MAGFVGAGKMAQALCRGMISSGLLKPKQITMSDPFIEQATSMKSLGVTLTNSNRQTVQDSKVVFLAVKPNIVSSVLREISPQITADHLIVSIAAGVSTSTIEQEVAPKTRVVRVTPNTPSLVRCGASVFSCGSHTKPQDAELVDELLSSVGSVAQIPEKLMDAATGISGSGPAYVYLAIEALSDGAVRMGIPRDLATQLAAQTVMGSAKMVIETGEHTGRLKDNVCSPGGTTIAGIATLEQSGFRSSLIQAVEAAAVRSAELGSASSNKSATNETVPQRNALRQSGVEEGNVKALKAFAR